MIMLKSLVNLSGHGVGEGYNKAHYSATRDAWDSGLFAHRRCRVLTVGILLMIFPKVDK